MSELIPKTIRQMIQLEMCVAPAKGFDLRIANGMRDRLSQIFGVAMLEHTDPQSEALLEILWDKIEASLYPEEDHADETD